MTVKRITLSYREKPVGGDVLIDPKISAEDETELAGAQHIVLLLHGYNNDLTDAIEAYNGFHARQRDIDENERYSIGRTFVEVYWPGDAAWGLASFLFYMGSIERAIQTADNLATYFAEHIDNTARIDIVAHSMGCRLGLELLRALQDRSAPVQIERIVFMAGAVPTFMLEQRVPPRHLRPSYNHVLREGARSLFSGADKVLAYAFPAGQSLAPGPEGLWPTALGHALWTDTSVPINLGQTENSRAGHSDYWGWNTKPGPLQCANNAAREVSDYLQFPSAGRRVQSTRFLSENTVIEARKILTSREVFKRDIAEYH